MDTLLNDVSDTALWVATYRASESKRPDALFDDYLAERLAGDRGKEIAKRMDGAQYTRWAVTIRTYVIDNYILELINEGVDTVLNLGAGLDTRPYRMNLPKNLRWIEADHSQIINLKEEKLVGENPRCQLERVKIDLSSGEARKHFLSKISSENKKVLVLTEGVVPYLAPDQVSTLAKDLLSQNSFHYWIVDYFSREVFKYMTRKKMAKQMKNAPFLFMPECDYFEFFRQNGWKERETRYLGLESQKLGRPIPTPWWAKILMFLFAPKDQSKHPLLKSNGYILLEPLR